MSLGVAGSIFSVRLYDAVCSIKSEWLENFDNKVFRYSFWETIPMFFNRLKCDFILVRSPQNFEQ